MIMYFIYRLKSTHMYRCRFPTFLFLSPCSLHKLEESLNILPLNSELFLNYRPTRIFLNHAIYLFILTVKLLKFKCSLNLLYASFEVKKKKKKNVKLIVAHTL